MILFLFHIQVIQFLILLSFILPSLVATFEASPSSKASWTRRQFLKPSRRIRDVGVITSLDWNWKIEAHSDTNSAEDDAEWVLNPVSNRKIKIDGPKWHEIMNRGGYICHDSNLFPIQLDRLWEWSQEESSSMESFVENDAAVNEAESQESPNTDWKRLDAEILSVEEPSNDAHGDPLPFLDGLFFVHKPCSLLTLPGIGDDKQLCLASLVNDWIPKNLVTSKPLEMSKNKKKKQKKTKPLKPFVPRPCHRLDYDTSGVIVIGLTRDALRLTNAMFEQKGADEPSSSANFLRKTYVALVAGAIDNEHGIINYPIGKVFNEANGFNQFVCLTDDCKWKAEDFVEKSLRDARTQYTVLKRFKLSTEYAGPSEQCVEYTKVKLEPLTGRGHQLRLHMAAIGHPILGDQLHAPATIAAATPRLCLHAEELELDVRVDEGNDGICVGRVRVRSTPPF